ncbi:hypothetical protein J5N97_028733 [Dioscorea zingiberensis]|uniref:Uncharacterized protein n=1 Tax=Dioscorea zingiberensis TaxID=325984 RepID=A0A9D5BZI8_9LILI|nr:hypothetical protein J5N97_028733 [Dioscorea zingiberensis]
MAPANAPIVMRESLTLNYLEHICLTFCESCAGCLLEVDNSEDLRACNTNFCALLVNRSGHNWLKVICSFYQWISNTVRHLKHMLLHLRLPRL